METSCNEKFHFTTDFMREHRKVWSLQNDVDLLNNIETFSQGLMKKTCFILDSMEEFHREINMTSISVKTLSNTFEGVSDCQFVENRVYDEEDDMIYEEDKTKTDSISLNLNKRLEESLKLCARTLESKFEAVSITISDSEDDIDIFNKGEVILIPKNRYKSRPLPHLVGGKEFYSDDSLGLLPSSNDPEEEENLFIGVNDNVQHSDTSGTDEVDNFFQKDSLFIDAGNEIKTVNVPEQIESRITENIEDVWKDIDHQDGQCLNDNLSEIKTESQSTIENFNPLNFQNMLPGMKMNAAIADEIKGIFGEENDDQARLPIFKKTHNTIYRETLRKVEDMQQLNDNSNNTNENELTKNVSTLFKNNVQPVLSNKNQSNAVLPKINEYQEEKMSEENSLPNIPTEVLHSFAKSRAKIKGKRRLPSRRLRNISHNSEADIIKQEPRDNNILSPSTDEEDLFVIPHVNIPKESSSNSLFGAPSLFSPGSSIEAPNTIFPSSGFTKKDTIEVDSNEELLEEPLGIKKSSLDSDKKNSNLFSDWDPFKSEESVLFSSVERRARKTKLFDDCKERPLEKSSKDNNDDDLFLFSNNAASISASSLFFSSSSSTVDFPNNSDEHTSKTNNLFMDNDDDSYSKNLFSSSNSDDLFFGSEKSGKKPDENKEKFNNLCSNPLMDTEDNLFD